MFAKFKVPENAISYGDVSEDGRWVVVNWVTLDKKVEIWRMQDETDLEEVEDVPSGDFYPTSDNTYMTWSDRFIPSSQKPLELKSDLI